MRSLKNKKMYIYTITILAIHIMLYFYLGKVKFGFLKNPYSHELMTFLKNVITQTLPIILAEILRIFIISKNKRNKVIIVLSTVLLILLQINYQDFLETLGDREKIFQCVCGEIIPIISYNILFTYLVLNKIYFCGIIYRFLVKLLILVSPVIPCVDWFAIGSTNILFAMIIFLTFKYRLLKPNNKNEKRRTSLERFKYFIALIFSISLVCFMLGMFKYQPISIISNSMSPLYKRGDVVIFKKLNEKELTEIQSGEIIVYNSDGKNIAHRVIDKIKKGDTVLYQTKGDNNDNPDTKFVKVGQILGVYTLHVKFLGFPSIWLYEYFSLE